MESGVGSTDSESLLPKNGAEEIRKSRSELPITRSRRARPTVHSPAEIHAMIRCPKTAHTLRSLDGVLLPAPHASATLPRMSLPRHWLCFALVLVAVAGCPRRFDPRANEIRSQNPQADAEYRAAQQQFQRGDLDAAKTAVQHIQTAYTPSEPLVGWARLLEARVARAQQQLDRSRELLQPLVEGATEDSLRSAARFELGLLAHRRGDAEEALRLLANFSSRIVEGDDATELHAVLADCYRQTGQAREALREYELFFSRAHPVEQAYVRIQVISLLSSLPPAAQTDARTRFGLVAPSKSEKAEAPASLRIGLALPLRGKDRALGERVLRGALWAAKTADPAGSASSPSTQPASRTAVELIVRDTGSAPESAAQAAADLAREGAHALVASPARSEAAAIARAAASGRLATLHLATPSPAAAAVDAQDYHLLYSNEERAQRLAKDLRAAGLATVVVLAPASAYGQAMTRAFVDALQGSSVRVLGQITFPANTTTFTAQAKQIIDLGPQALFVPATATQLELVAGQLAALGALSTQRVQTRSAEPTIQLLLSTAEGLSTRLLTAAGRYLQGALLAPVALAGLPLVGGDTRFSGYSDDGGSLPGLLDAIGYDAVQTLRAACAEPAAKGQACTTEQLTSHLQRVQLDGATGTIAFQPNGRRRGQPLLVRIEGAALRVLR